MAVIPFTAIETVSAVLTLSQRAWKLGSLLSRLHQNTRTDDSPFHDLQEEVKSLGNECDLVYAELEDAISKCDKGSPPADEIESRVWDCLATNVEETNQTMRELETSVKIAVGEETDNNSPTQLQAVLGEADDVRMRVHRHTDNLHATLVLITTLLGHADRSGRGLAQELDTLQAMAKKLQRPFPANAHPPPSHAEAILTQCMREVIHKGAARYNSIQAAESVASGQTVAHGRIRVAEWINRLDSIRRSQRQSDPSDVMSSVSSTFTRDEARSLRTSATSPYMFEQQLGEMADTLEEDSDDDLNTDLAKAALETGTKAFEDLDWEEADSLLQEALQLLQQLPTERREFCELFSLQYKLAVCAYHMEEPAVAEEALKSLAQQSVRSNKQRENIYDASHLLSQLYIHTGQVDRARSECEAALQGRRRLLGKQSNAALESTALAAHIHVLLKNRARAKSYLAMIPTERREAVLKAVEESLDTKVDVDHLDSASVLSQPTSEELDMAVQRIQDRFSTSPLVQNGEEDGFGAVSEMVSRSLAVSPRPPHQPIRSYEQSVENSKAASITSSATEKRSVSSIKLEASAPPAEAGGSKRSSSGVPPSNSETSKGGALSRKEILERIGCRPRDQIEDAVCEGDHKALSNLLSKKKDLWRSKWRKRSRPERVTALHFAALFGEVDMARRLLSSGFNINEVPYGYSTSLTPLTFAVGARRVDMVDFLIANGAKPSEPDSWSTLAGQLMNRSWLMKTMSESEKDDAPLRIIAIMRILLRQGWNVNAPFDSAGTTVLHQATTFWTGSYSWDLDLRAALTSFLCEVGANPLQANMEGKTPYDVASASGQDDVLLLLGQDTKSIRKDRPTEPVELPSAPIRHM